LTETLGLVAGWMPARPRTKVDARYHLIAAVEQIQLGGAGARGVDGKVP
jgi:hypothetical protein